MHGATSCIKCWFSGRRVASCTQNHTHTYIYIYIYCVHRRDEVDTENIYERAQQFSEERHEICKFSSTKPQVYVFGDLQCLFGVHVGGFKGTSRKETAGSLFKHLNDKVGQCKVGCDSFLYAGIQHEVLSGFVFSHQCVIDANMFIGKDEEAICDVILHEAHRSVLGAVVWIVFTRAELAVYVQALRRMAHAPRIKDCKRLNIVIRHVERHICGLESVTFPHPFKLVAFMDAVVKAQFEEFTGLALRGLVAVLCGDGGGHAPSRKNNNVNFIDFIVRRQRRVFRSIFSAELDGLVDRIE